jgi:hypothetical protein
MDLQEVGWGRGMDWVDKVQNCEYGDESPGSIK